MGRVLVIDDDPKIHVLIKKILGSPNVKVIEAQNGAEGLSLASSRDPDLILCDMMMPVMDGMEFLRAWSSNEAIAHIPVMMLTSISEKVRIIEAIKLGACDYVVKPFDPLSVRMKVAKLLKEITTTRQTGPGGGVSPIRKGRPLVTVASGSDQVRRFAIEALGNEHDVVQASDGAECLHLITEEHPDLLLLSTDIALIGWQDLVERLRRQDETQAVRIAVMTSTDGSDPAGATFDPPLAGIIELPLSGHELKTSVERLLDRDKYYFYDGDAVLVLKLKSLDVAASGPDRDAFNARLRLELLDLCDDNRNTLEVDLREIGPVDAQNTVLLDDVLGQAGTHGIRVTFKTGSSALSEVLKARGVFEEQVLMEAVSPAVT